MDMLREMAIVLREMAIVAVASGVLAISPAYADDVKAIAELPQRIVRVVASEAPADGELQLDGDPLLALGEPTAAAAVQFGAVAGALRLDDGSVVVGLLYELEVRRFGPDGQLLWSRGGRGEAPGEFNGLQLMRRCHGDRLVVWDRYLRRLTEFDHDGEVLGTRRVDLPAYRADCAPDGAFVFTGWGDYSQPAEVGEQYRWEVPLYVDQGQGPQLLRADVPGPDRVRLSNSDGPLTWGRTPVLGATSDGVWLGTGDAYELELIGWNGTTALKAVLDGPSQKVTDADLRAYRAQRMEAISDESGRARFGERWRRTRSQLPSTYPAYDKLLDLPDGGVLVRVFPRPGAPREWHRLDRQGNWTHRLLLGPNTDVLDAGADWALLLVRDELDIETVELYALAEK